ncbi:MAG: hypothetical protein K9L57_12180 [Spirochaetaceae bacterium]|nr:hypothetical protein [Spirochaetaceae bacterium]
MKVSEKERRLAEELVADAKADEVEMSFDEALELVRLGTSLADEGPGKMRTYYRDKDGHVKEREEKVNLPKIE